MEGDAMLRLWRCQAKPPAPDAAARWLCRAACGWASAAAAPTLSASQMATALATDAARLIAAPHQPRASKWGAFAPLATCSNAKSSGGSALHQQPAEAPSWAPAGLVGMPPRVSTPGAFCSGGGSWESILAHPAGTSWGGRPAMGSSGGWGTRAAAPDIVAHSELPLQPAAPEAGTAWQAPPPGMRQQQQAQQQKAAKEMPAHRAPVGMAEQVAGFADYASMVRAGTNSPPAMVRDLQQHRQHQQQAMIACGRQPIVFPSEIQAVQPRGRNFSGPRLSPLQPQHVMRGDSGGFRQQQQRQHQQKQHPQQQQTGLHLCGAISGHSVGGAATEVHRWQAAAVPTAAELMLFVQQQGLQSTTVDVGMEMWLAEQSCGAVGGTLPRQQGSVLPAAPSHPAYQLPPPAQEQQHYQFGDGRASPRQQQLPPQQQPWQEMVPPPPAPQQQQPSPPPHVPVQPLAQLAEEQATRAAAPALRQAVLVSAAKYVSPEPESPYPPAWQKAPAALQPLKNQGPQQPQKPQQANERKERGNAAASSHGMAASVGDGSDFEDGGATQNLPAAKRQRRRQPAGVHATAGAAPPASAEHALPARELLEVGPSTGVVDAATPLGYSRFAADMQEAPSCSIGVLCIDSSGSQFYSTLEPLTKEQQQRIKAAAAAAAGGGGGSKKQRGSGKVKGKAATPSAAPASAASGSGGNAASPAAVAAACCGGRAGGGRPVALCLLPIHVNAQTGQGAPGATLYFLPLAAGVLGGYEMSSEAAGQGRDIARQLLANAEGGAILAFNMQALLRLLSEAGVEVPAPHHLTLADPRLLAWLLEPQLLQGGDKELQDYSLHELAERHLGGMPPGSAAADTSAAATAGPAASSVVAMGGSGCASSSGSGAATPVQRMRRALGAAVALGEAMYAQLADVQLPPETAKLEMQVAALLAQMERAGLGFDPWLLREAGHMARGHMARLEEECATLAGCSFNLASPSQLAGVLYTVLRLPPPVTRGRSSAKTHLATDEHALEALKAHSPLPSLVLEYRALLNFTSKWVEADWCRAAAGGYASAEAYAAAHPGAGGWPRVHCYWHQTSTATGRLSSSAPNLQAVTKYQLETAGAEGLVNIRDAFVAPQGCVLVSADYSQVELRVLAHLSSDQALVALLQQAGTAGDAFKHIAARWLGSGDVVHVSKEDREKAKRVTYGIIYGLTAFGLAQGSGALGISVSAAQGLINSFLSHFKGVATYVDATKAAARAQGGVRTLAGRQRPIKGLTSSDKRVRSEAERKAVNTSIQGSAADLMKRAMVDWCRWLEAAEQPPVRVVAQLHDELILEVDARQVEMAWVAQELRRVMEGVAQLRVPLAVRVKAGERWGSMVTVQ